MTPPSELTQEAEAFRQALIDWYDLHARDLPWRRRPSLYKTVVSEFMLQQTQVKTVLPYFGRWLERFPDFAALAAAPEEAVLKHWEGLGYYSRARNLHRLAKAYNALDPDDRPTDAARWLDFPGVGPYAAAAICSIAFADRSAVVDGNVVRILARITADDSLYKNSSEASKAYRSLANSLLNPQRPGDHNQAMMELGATICQKRKPQCLLCPAQPFCQASQRGIEANLPRLGKINFEEQIVDRAWIRNQEGSVLLRKVPQSASRMKGLHELPTLEQAGLQLESGERPVLERKRSITRYRITERIYSLAPQSLDRTLHADCLWARPEDLETLPFSGPHRRWIDELLTLHA